MRDRGRPVDHTGRGERPERVEPLVRERDVPHQPEEPPGAGHPDHEPHGHLERELPHDRPDRAVGARRVREHPDHQRDADGIVRSGLALEDRRRPPADLPVAEHREHDRRIGGRERGAQDARDRPVEAEERVGEERHRGGGGERPRDPERRDRQRSPAESPPADVHAAVEEDDDQGHDADPLDVVDRDHGGEPREEVRGERRSEQEERGRRHREALRELVRPERREEAGRHDQDDRPEFVELAHRRDCRRPASAALDAACVPIYAFLTFRSTGAQGGAGYFGAV